MKTEDRGQRTEDRSPKAQNRGQTAVLHLPSSVLLFLLALLGGCVTQPQRQGLVVCPGKATAEEALQTLTARAQGAVPVWATGRAVLTYHAPDKKKPERHSLDLVFRFDPPARVYLQGSVTAIPRAVILGSNEKEFWLALKPKEISSYYIGRWQDVRDFEGLVMSPRVVLEAVGIVNLPGTEPNPALWKLENKGPYDILTQRDESGHPVRRLHVYACDYTVREIEYFDRRGKVVAVARLDGYKPLEKGFSVPTQISVVSMRPDGRKDSVAMDLSSVWTKPFNAKQQQIFRPPDADKYEHVYRYEEGQWVPE
ncbi:MAG: hypothetical protein M1376_21000 [Planctomycetes bacterium]|nr:hypothetical protein [Planctomycetota bacterium]